MMKHTNDDTIHAIHTTVVRLYQDTAIRQQCLEILANSIEHAHRNGANAAVWAVTLRQDGAIVLKVGLVDVCGLGVEDLMLFIHPNVVDTTLATQLQLHARQTDPPSFTRVPLSQDWGIPSQLIPTLWPSLQKPYQAFIEEAAASVIARTNYYRQHSPEVIQYLRVALQRHVPAPNYAVSEETLRARKKARRRLRE